MGVFSQLKQIKDLKKQAKDMQDQLSHISETADAGWNDKVKITMNGNQDVTKVEIDEGLLGADKKAKLEELVQEAFNKANKKVKKIMAEEMMKQQGGMSGLLNKMKELDKEETKG